MNAGSQHMRGVGMAKIIMKPTARGSVVAIVDHIWRHHVAASALRLGGCIKVAPDYHAEPQ